MSEEDISHWGDLEKTPKSKQNAFNTSYVIGDRFDTRRAQMHENARKRTTATVEKMRARGTEPAKLTISNKQAARDREVQYKSATAKLVGKAVEKMNWKLK